MDQSSSTVSSLHKPNVGALADWLAVRRRATIVGIVVLSFAVRLSYFLELNDGPCIVWHHWDQSDSNFFDRWAKEIAAGDWLTDQKLYPDHVWYTEIADEYLRQNPDKREKFAKEAAEEGITPARAVWNHWYGGKKFHQEPFYAYFIALNYCIFGDDARFVFFWQMLAGTGTNLLIYLLSRKYFGDIVAIVAGLMAVLCSTLLFYELTLLRESLLVFSGLALVYLTELVRGDQRWLPWAGYGCAVGAALLVKTIFLPYWLSILLITIVGNRKNLTACLVPVLASTAGVIAALSPFMARNLAVGVSPYGIAGTGGATFICTNAADVKMDRPLREGPVSFRYLPEIMGSTNGQFVPAVAYTLLTHRTYWSYATLIWNKFALLWHWYESPDNCNFYYFQLHSAVLNFMPITFYVLSPLAMVGLLLGAPQLRQCWPLYLYVVAFIALQLVFCPLSRWRNPLVAALIPFAALTLVSIWRWLATRQWFFSALSAGAVLFLFSWTSRPLPGDHLPIRYSDYAVAVMVYYEPHARSLESAGRWDKAADLWQNCLRFAPKLQVLLSPASDDQVALTQYFAGVYWRCAMAYEQSGQMGLANTHKIIAERLSTVAQALKEAPSVP